MIVMGVLSFQWTSLDGIWYSFGNEKVKGRRIMLMEKRKCPECGTKFKPRVDWAVYCSPRCGQRVRQRKWRKTATHKAV
jgi:predicted RNA-binding Zn-ribbon protein involved in translation (DUF1610 family)